MIRYQSFINTMKILINFGYKFTLQCFLPFWKELFCRFREYVVAEARKFGAGLVSLEAREFRSGGGGHWFNPWGGSGNNWLFLNFFKASEVNIIVLVVEVGGIEPLECRFLLASFTNSISFQPENKKYKMKYLCNLFSQSDRSDWQYFFR